MENRLMPFKSSLATNLAHKTDETAKKTKGGTDCMLLFKSGLAVEWLMELRRVLAWLRLHLWEIRPSFGMVCCRPHLWYVIPLFCWPDREFFLAKENILPHPVNRFYCFVSHSALKERLKGFNFICKLWVWHVHSYLAHTPLRFWSSLRSKRALFLVSDRYIEYTYG